jgi:hypothetical protein
MGLPAVYTIDEYFLFCPTAASIITNAATPSRWSDFPGPAGRRTATRKFSDYIAISRFQLDVVGQRLPPGRRTHLISNQIDVPDLGPKPCDMETAAQFFCWICHFR